MEVLEWIVDFIAKYWWIIIIIVVVGLFLRDRFNGDSDDQGDDDQPPGPACPA